MAIKSTEELLNAIKARVGEDNSDEALEFIEDVWTPLVDFEDGLCGDSRCLEALESAFGCKELPSVGYELPRGGQDCLMVPWGDRDEDSPPGWQRRLRSLLGLEECQPQVL